MMLTELAAERTELPLQRRAASSTACASAANSAALSKGDTRANYQHRGKQNDLAICSADGLIMI
jgi:hypothetical protein